MTVVRITPALLVLASLFLVAGDPASAQAGPPFFRTQPEKSDPKTVLRDLQRATAFESSASKLALQRTRNPRVRTLAKKLSIHASVVHAGLQALALEEASLPSGTQLARTDRQSLEQLQRLDEPNFDARYLEAMRGLYEELLQSLRSFQQNGRGGGQINSRRRSHLAPNVIS